MTTSALILAAGFIGVMTVFGSWVIASMDVR